MGSQGRDTVSSIPLLGLFIQWYIWALKDTVAHRKKKHMFIGCGRDNLVDVNAWKVLLCYFFRQITG